MRMLIALLTASLLLGGCVSKSKYDQQLQANSELTRNLASVREDNSRLERELQSITERLRAEQQRWETEITHLQADLDDKNNRLDELYQKSDRLEADKTELGRELEKEQIARAARIANLKNTYDQLVGTLEEELQRERAARETREAKIKSARRELESSLAKEIGRQQLQLEGGGTRLTLHLAAAALFNVGQAELNPEGRNILQRVGKVLKGLDDTLVMVEGHSDSLPITGALKERYPSNWELSSARASSVARDLQTRSGLSGERLVAAGYAQYRPVADNDTPEGRAANRRIQIVLLPLTAAKDK